MRTIRDKFLDSTFLVRSKLCNIVFIVLLTLPFKTVEAQSFQDAYRDFQNQNYGAASKIFISLAKQDDPRAQALFGICFSMVWAFLKMEEKLLNGLKNRL